jgi:hypothetical protein
MGDDDLSASVDPKDIEVHRHTTQALTSGDT